MVRAMIFKEQFIANNYLPYYYQTIPKFLEILRPNGRGLFSRILAKLNYYLCLSISQLSLILSFFILWKFDGVIILKYCPSWYLKVLKVFRLPTLFEADDPMWISPFGTLDSFKDRIKNCDYVSVENALQLNAVRHLHKNVFITRGSPQLELFQARARQPVFKRKDRDHFIIGWVGSPSTVFYLKPVIPSLNRLAETRNDFVVRLVGVGGQWESSNIKFPVQIVPTYSQSEMIDEVVNFDIGLFPLFNDELSALRGTLKARIYMSGKAAVVANRVGEVPHLIEDRVSGMIIDQDSDWEKKLDDLMSSPENCKSIGDKGFELVSQKYSVKACFGDLEEGFLKRIDRS